MAACRFHILTTLQEIRGNENHARSLLALLRLTGEEARLWSDRATPYAARMGATAIQPFSGVFPRGGTLILLGTWLKLEPWIHHARPERVILICNTSEATQLFASIASLKRAGVEHVDLVYISSRLQAAMQLPGYLCPLLIDLKHFHPAIRNKQPTERLVLGRHSRDTLEKHHPNDPGFYRMLSWKNWDIRLMGATCISEKMRGYPSIQLLPTGAEDAAEFLRSLDVFFYRTHPAWHEAAGRIILEAMACGLPVVAHTSGGYTDWIVHGENGFLFSSQEDGLDCLQQLKADPALRARMSSAARATAETHSGTESDAVKQYRHWLLGTLHKEVER